MLEHLNKTPSYPKRVVVMGASGFVGGSLVKRLEAEGISVLALSSKNVDLLATDASAKLIELIEHGDAFVAVSAKAPVKNPEMMIDNIIMARAMTEALKKCGSDVSHVINISSDAVFADTPTPLTEASCSAPGSYHGVMHMGREVMFKTEIDAPLAILRPTLIYGAGDPHNGYGPNKFRRQVANGEDIILFGEGEERRDHVLIDDVAEIIFLTLIHRSQGALNIATGHVASFREIAELVISKHAKPVLIKGSKRTGAMPHNGYRPFDISACQNAFPEFRYTPIEEGLSIAQGKD